MSNFNDSGRFGEISNQSTVVVNCQHDVDDLNRRMEVNTETAYIYKGADATVDPATSRIDINDICFTVGDGKSSRRSIMNNAIPVASNCNGLMIQKTKRKGREIDDPENEEEVRLALLETIRVIGQAIGASNPLPEREENIKLNFTVRTQGTAHILNTGNEGFCPGESVYIDLFKRNEIYKPGSSHVTEDWKKKFARYGFSLRKIPLKLTKIDTASKNYEWSLKREMIRRSSHHDNHQNQKPLLTAGGEFANAIINFMKDIQYISNANDDDLSTTNLIQNRKDDASDMDLLKEFVKRDEMDDNRNKLRDKAFTDLINGIKYLYNDLDRRKIGTCMSFAKSGKGMDINLSI
jgi:hypothetical protein